MTIVEEILKSRKVPREEWAGFLNPDYDKTCHDPFLLPDMDKAVKRIAQAVKNDEKVVIYGDYDVDGVCATTILTDALPKFGLSVKAYMPNRFTEGYGLNSDAIKSIADTSAKLVIAVDCGSTSVEEIKLANKLGLEVIVADHHSIDDNDLPPAVAVINPHRKGSKYPFKDLAGSGVAFKLIQALQIATEKGKRADLLGFDSSKLGSANKSMRKTVGLSHGLEKWLLDLVALGTVCDIVPLLGENRNNVYWGIEVLKKTRRPGLRALMAVAKIRPNELTARHIGFVLGPRLNAAGRLDTAEMALELLMTSDNAWALELAQKLDKLNYERREEQNKIFVQATAQLDSSLLGSLGPNGLNASNGLKDEEVLVVAGKGWNEGVIGIVATKIMEKCQKPAFVVAVNDGVAKGSGRSFGDFDLARAIEATREHLTKGGGHAAAGGVSLDASKIDGWRMAVNKYYKSLKLKNQQEHLLPKEDTTMTVIEVLTVDLVNELTKLEPFGMGNEQPVFKLEGMRVKYVDRIGREKNHLKLTVSDGENQLKFLAFSPPEEWFVEQGEKVDLWVNLEINEWQGSQTVEGRILRITT